MEQNKDISIYNSVFRIGIVHSVDGRVVKVLVDKDKNNSHLIFQGQLIKNVAVGSYVKVLKGFETILLRKLKMMPLMVSGWRDR